MQIPFRNRADAGRRLGAALREYAGRHDVIVIAVPRGGVEVGCQVAAALELPLDVLNVRKLVCPGRRELTLGAIAPGGIRILNEQAIQQAGISGAQLDKIESVERRELDRREWAYRNGRSPLNVAGLTVLLVDDGLATGSTMSAALEVVRRMRPARILIAVPVGATDSCDQLRKRGYEVVCPRTPEPYIAVELWYQDYPQLDDDDVHLLLESSHSRAVLI